MTSEADNCTFRPYRKC